MSVYIRKNLLVATATFVAADGSDAQPSLANLVVNYNDISGVNRSVVVPMIYTAGDDDTVGTWAGTWDSSASKTGNVDWMIYGVGSLQAATQGSIQIVANSANTI